MKKRILALLLPCALLFSGCASMLERSYVSSASHMDYSVTEDASILRAETYQGLVNSILYFVNAHENAGTIRLYNYTGDVETDLANACDEVLYEDPLGAYAARSIRYDSTRILTYYEVSLRITYSQSAESVDAIRDVVGTSGLRQELAHMVSERQERGVFLLTYFSGDSAEVGDLLNLAILNEPALFQAPGGLSDYDFTIRFYPEKGIRRILEINIPWTSITGGTEKTANYIRELETAAAQLLEDTPPVGEQYTVEELIQIIRAASGPADLEGSPRALDVLTGAPAADTGLLMAMEYLCRQAGIEVSPVCGSNGFWLIVSTPNGYRHLLPRILWPYQEGPDGEYGDGELPEGYPLFTDEQLSALGITWPGGLHPACVDYSGGTDG